MAVASQGKGRGLIFAEQQLLRHGWEQGKGLGKDENGISEAIKVKVKCDKGGVGHKQSEQFTFHWWDHVFNKASSGLDVESGQDGVVVKKIEGEEEEGMISNKKPRKAKLNKSALYGSFVKSATLLSGQKHPEQRSSNSEDSSSSDDEEKLDLSSTTKLSDEALMKACGGRTAHKGARHGLKMSAKLARLEQQEQEFIAKYGKKNLKSETAQSQDTPYSTETSSVADQEVVIKTKKKKPKKKEQDSTEILRNCFQVDDASIEASQIRHNNETAKKRKKCYKEQPSDTQDALVDSKEGVRMGKKRKYFEQAITLVDVLNRSQDYTESFQQQEVTVANVIDEITGHPLTGDSVSKKSKKSKKKKKKKKKHSKNNNALEENQNNNSVINEDCSDSKGSHLQQQQEEGSVVLPPACDRVPKKKKKKSSKSNKESLTADLESAVLQSNTVELNIEGEDIETMAGDGKRSKSKKRKRRREEDQGGIVEN